MIFTRRNFFGMAVGGALYAQSPVAKRSDMITLAARPQDLEMPITGFEDYITPIDHFFVRTHVYVPKVDAAAWKLQIGGEVATPLTFTLDEIRRMPAVEMIAVQECAGNGRSLFRPNVGGLQWSNGGVGNGRFRGVRLADLLKRAGIKSSAVEVLFDGEDDPLGKMQDFRRSITARKALNENTLLAYEMNGQALPLQHGFPLRVIAPGWASDSWVKWVTTITVLDKEFDGFWMKSSYRKPEMGIAPGSNFPADKMVPVTSLRVKSVIWSPLDGTPAMPGQPLTIRGVAWSGDSGPVTSVQVSVDNGRSWRLAELKPEQFTEFGWRQFQFEWTPTREGYFTVMSRASDGAGNTQTFAEEWNPAGYGWNLAPKAGINVTRTPGPAAASSARAPIAIQQKTIEQACHGCHGDEVITQQHLSRGQWDREITKMTNWGAEVKTEDRADLIDYLLKNFGPRE